MKLIQGLADGTIEEYRKAANEATGISHDMAETMQDTLKVQMTIASSAIEGLMIEIGKVIAPYTKIAVYWFIRAISGIAKFLKEQPDYSRNYQGNYQQELMELATCSRRSVAALIKC